MTARFEATDGETGRMLDDGDAMSGPDRDDDNWVSPYLRRRLRSLEEVLAERRADAARSAEITTGASGGTGRGRVKVVQMTSASGKLYGRVA